VLTFEEFVERFGRADAARAAASNEEIVEMLAARPAVGSWAHVPLVGRCFVYWASGKRGLYLRGTEGLWALEPDGADAVLPEPFPATSTVPAPQVSFVLSPFLFGTPEAEEAIRTGQVIMADVPFAR
jgi:hypothetical protein